MTTQTKDLEEMIKKCSDRQLLELIAMFILKLGRSEK